MSKNETYRRWHRPPRGERFASKTIVTTSPASVGDARARITLEHIAELGAHLCVPVTLDRTGWLRDEIEG
jgi:hypothetical protein